MSSVARPVHRPAARPRRRPLLSLCGVLVRAVGLDDREGAGDQGEDEKDGSADQHDPQAPDQPGLCAGSLGGALLLELGEVGGRSRNSRSPPVRAVSRGAQSSARTSRTPR